MCCKLANISFHYSTNKLLEEHFSIYTRDEKKYLDIKDEKINKIEIIDGYFQYDKNKDL